MIKIIDFGLACNVPLDKKEKSFVGTLLFMAPEVVLNSVTSDKQDIWGLAMTVYYLLTKNAPYTNIDDNDSITQSMKDFQSPKPNGKIYLILIMLLDPLFASLSPSCADFLS